uniref:Uncharacterized protein n=1 Tax=Rhizophora mucronata TaxID=61149 RepID=A0A2P2PU58_RHIMU
MPPANWDTNSKFNNF